MNTKKVLGAALGLGVLALPAVSSASIVGSLGNFDVINDTGETAHGFEIELEDLYLSDIRDIFGGPGRRFPTGTGFDPATAVVRYGAPTVEEYDNGVTRGVRVTYAGTFNGSTWDFGTPSGTFLQAGDRCWTGGGIGYSATTPCDHFGVGTLRAPTRTNYAWLLETATPGELAKGGVSLPAPVWSVAAPVGGIQQVVAVIEAPEVENELQFGEAIWVKVFTTEIENEVELENLVGGDPVIDGAETEIEWQLLQSDPENPAAGQLESEFLAAVGENGKSIIHRYEFYEYTGPYNPEDHEALVLHDTSPSAGELGHYLGAQNAAVNLAPVPLPPAVALMGLPLLALVRRARK
ncbi:MAG: PEP-CTERM sorting domain-containing protein [Gammaproteobacteria bacterium]|nr:PEP-CTERM sorting domain-containing protein [Gammaproteobacteria bacterium]